MTHLLSAFGGFLWIIPVGVAVAIYFVVKAALKQSKQTGEKFLETGFGKWTVGLVIALILIVLAMYADR